MPNPTWNIGNVVQDREDDDPDPAIVVNVPGVPADEWDVPRFGKTIAEDNPDYPADALVVTILFEDNLNYSFPNWERDTKISYDTLDGRGLQYYSFPAPRLESAEPTEEATKPNAQTNGDSAPTNGTHASAASGSSTDTSAEDSSAEPSDAVRALEARPEDGGMTTELESDGRTIRATKLGDTYRVCPNGVLDGDGPLRSRLEEIVS